MNSTFGEQRDSLALGSAEDAMVIDMDTAPGLKDLVMNRF